MGLGNVVFLGLLQGIAEFLPISSSGHLVIAQSFMGLKEPALALDVALHFGTLLSIVVVFRKEIVKIFNGLLGSLTGKQQSIEQKAAGKVGMFILLGSIPAGIIGVLFNDQIEKLFQNVNFVGFALLITAGLLFVGNSYKKGKGDFSKISAKDTLIIGSWQAFAILPGISRSGSTIVGAIFRGIDEKTAAKFSLLLSIPAVLGANIISLGKMNTGSISVLSLFAGVIVAFVSGMIAINILIKMAVKRKLNLFAWWCLAVGLVTIILKAK